MPRTKWQFAALSLSYLRGSERLLLIDKRAQYLIKASDLTINDNVCMLLVTCIAQN